MTQVAFAGRTAIGAGSGAARPGGTGRAAGEAFDAALAAAASDAGGVGCEVRDGQHQRSTAATDETPSPPRDEPSDDGCAATAVVAADPRPQQPAWVGWSLSHESSAESADAPIATMEEGASDPGEAGTSGLTPDVLVGAPGGTPPAAGAANAANGVANRAAGGAADGPSSTESLPDEPAAEAPDTTATPLPEADAGAFASALSEVDARALRETASAEPSRRPPLAGARDDAQEDLEAQLPNLEEAAPAVPTSVAAVPLSVRSASSDATLEHAAFDDHKVAVTPLQPPTWASADETTLAPAADTARPMPAEAQAAFDQVVKSLRMQWKQGLGEARILLRPEHLGPVDVSIRVAAGSVTAVVRAESAQVQEWLVAHQHSLRQQLEAAGLRLDDLVVTRDGERRRQSQEGHESPRRPRPRRHDPSAPTFSLLA